MTKKASGEEIKGGLAEAAPDEIEGMALSRRGWAWPRTFTSFRYRPFIWFWLSGMGTFSAMMMHMIARGWLMLELTDSSLWLGLVSASFGLPLILFSPLGGVLTDRMEKRSLLLLTQGAVALITVFIAVLIATDAIQAWHLLVYSFFHGSIQAFNHPGRQAVVPELVAEKDLMNGIALNASGQNLTRIAAPALAGVLLGFIDVAGVYYIVIALYLFAFFTLTQVPATGIRTRRPGVPWQKDLAEGLSYIRSRPLVVQLLLLSFVSVLLGMPYMMLLPIFARDVLGRGPQAYGLLMAMTGIGALFGSLIIASLGDFRHKGYLILGMGLMQALALVAFAQSSTLLPSLASLFFLGATMSAYQAVSSTVLLSLAEDEVRGRVMSIYMMTWGMQPFAALPAGVLAEEDALGSPLTLTIYGGALSGLMVGAILFLPRMRRLH